ncbi:MAG: AbrB/MazE/SpoVT family DNA-binding domain-containing protein [Pyrinomonadaceae bacterium]
MKVQIQKWGNSLALRIPKSFAVESNVTRGSTVEVSMNNGTIVVTPVEDSKYTLEDLVDGITDENRHDEIEWGRPVGNEVW